MIVAYDFDGVLSEKPPASQKKWGKMNGAERQARKDFLLKFYMTAPALHSPTERSFYVITARKNSPDIVTVSTSWLKYRFGDRVLGVYFLSKSRSVKNVVAFKAQILKQIMAQKFVEDNLKVLKGLKEQTSGVELIFYSPDGVMTALDEVLKTTKRISSITS